MVEASLRGSYPCLRKVLFSSGLMRQDSARYRTFSVLSAEKPFYRGLKVKGFVRVLLTLFNDWPPEAFFSVIKGLTVTVAGDHNGSKKDVKSSKQTNRLGRRKKKVLTVAF